jgi:hypothetical protein
MLRQTPRDAAAVAASEARDSAVRWYDKAMEGGGVDEHGNPVDMHGCLSKAVEKDDGFALAWSPPSPAQSPLLTGSGDVGTPWQSGGRRIT